MRERLERLTVVGSGVAELARNRAEEILKEVRASEVGGQMSSLVRELVERTEQNRREILSLVRAEMRSQMISLGLATERDLERLERRIARLEEQAAASAAQKGTAKTSPRKTTERRRAAQKAAPGEAEEDPRKESRADRDLARQASRRAQPAGRPEPTAGATGGQESEPAGSSGPEAAGGGSTGEAGGSEDASP